MYLILPTEKLVFTASDEVPEINIPDVTLSTPAPQVRENTGVENARENAGVADNMHGQNTGVESRHETSTPPCGRFFHDTNREHRRMNEQIMDEHYGPRNHHFNLRD
jgi:hypothetical protein